MAASLFDRINMLGAEWARGRLTSDSEAHGRGVGVVGPDPVCDRWYSSGREALPGTNDPLVMRLAEPPEPCDWRRSA